MNNPLQSPRVKGLILIALLGVWAFFLLTPVVNTLIRYATLLSFGLVWAYVLWWAWSLPKLRYAWLGVSALMGLLLAFGFRPGLCAGGPSRARAAD